MQVYLCVVRLLQSRILEDYLCIHLPRSLCLKKSELCSLFLCLEHLGSSWMFVSYDGLWWVTAKDQAIDVIIPSLRPVFEAVSFAWILALHWQASVDKPMCLPFALVVVPGFTCASWLIPKLRLGSTVSCSSETQVLECFCMSFPFKLTMNKHALHEKSWECIQILVLRLFSGNLQLCLAGAYHRSCPCSGCCCGESQQGLRSFCRLGDPGRITISWVMETENPLRSRHFRNVEMFHDSSLSSLFRWWVDFSCHLIHFVPFWAFVQGSWLTNQDTVGPN